MSICHPHDPEPAPASPEALWGNARGCWEAFALLFGTALQLVGGVFIRQSERNQANAYLRALEALVRRLLLVEAVAAEAIGKNLLHPQSGERWLTAKPADGGRPAPQADTPAPDPYEDRYDTEDQTKWPAHFALRLNTLLGANQRGPGPDEQRDPTLASHWPGKPPCKPPPHPLDTPGDHPRFTFAAPIALRFEALRRVIADPNPYIRRTVRALAAFKRRNRPPRLLAATRIAGDNSRFFHRPLTLIEQTCADALDRLWPDTS